MPALLRGGIEQLFQIKNANLSLYSCLVFFTLLILPLSVFPISPQTFWFSKWAVVYVFSISFIGITFFEKDNILPKISIISLSFLCSIFLIYLLSCYHHHISILTPSFLERGLFLLVSLASYNAFITRKFRIETLFWASSVSLIVYLSYSIKEIIGCFYAPISSIETLSTSFGNINMSVEYVALSMICLMMYSGKAETKLNQLTLKLFVFFAGLYCYFAGSRSIYIFLILSCIYLYVTRHREENKKIYDLFKIIIIQFILCYLFVKIFHSISTTNALAKINSTTDRYQLIMATISMIKDHPFGVGAGQYDMALIPYFSQLPDCYGETYLARSPHNEFLRYTAEDGIPYITFCLLFVVSIIRDSRRKISNLFASNPFLTLSLIFYGVQFSFQFPMQNSYPFLMAAILSGYLLSLLFDANYYTVKNIGLKIISLKISGFLFLFYVVIAVTISEYLMFWHYYSIPHTTLAYQLNSDNWSAATQSAELNIREGNYDVALETIQTELHRRPYNFSALYALARVNFLQGNDREGCDILQKVDGYFHNKSIYHEFIQGRCIKDK